MMSNPAVSRPQEAPMPRRGYPYRRYSDSYRQQDGHSIERQEDWARLVCEQRGWIHDDTYALVDRGKSGFHQKNLTPTAGLTRFLGLIRQGMIAPGSVLLIENLDRLSRAAVKKAHKIFQEILEAGVWICTRTPDRIYRGDDSENYFELMEPLWLMYLSWMESLKKSQRIGDLWKKHREQARASGRPLGVRPPFWLEKSATGYVFSPQAPIARQMLRLALEQDLGANLIAKRMHQAGIPSPARSGHWLTSFVRQVLVNPALCGRLQLCTRSAEGRWVPAGEPLEGYYPALLSVEEFDRLQTTIRARHRKRGRPAVQSTNLFVGLIRDAESRQRLYLCGSLRQLSTGLKRYNYLGRDGRRGGSIPYEPLERALLQTLTMLRPEDVCERPEELTVREQQIDELTRQCLALTHRREQLQAAAADPQQDLTLLLPALQAVAGQEKELALKRDRLKEESRSGRLEALAQTQT